MAKKVKLNPYRSAVQWIIASLLVYLIVRPLFDKTYMADFEAYCPFGGLQAISSFLVNNSLACSMTTTQIFMGFALVLAIFIISKLFCSFICPIGSFTEWLGRLGKKMNLNIHIAGFADKALRLVKYALLFLTFYFSVTSSELFCKTFDPYYAIFSGFSNDVVVSYAALALLLAIPGSFFIRQFWCKYTCPLGAVSNIFSYSYIFIGITGFYLLITLVLNASISWVWLLGVLCLTGFILEIFKVRTFGPSLFKITRNTELCTSCNLCNKSCPMNLKVASMESVKDVDCHLCGDCVASCPEKNTLHIVSKSNPIGKIASGKMLWVPAFSIVMLVLLALAFAEKVHIPTISIKWGNEHQMLNAGSYEQSGLKSIKCFGSSMSFANHMKELEGVLGVETFVGDHTVRVFYDKNRLNEEEIKKAIFTPVRQIINAPRQNVLEISIVEAAIDQFFDPNDAFLLAQKFKQTEGILAVQTQFGEPVHALIYYDSDKITIQKIKEIIENKKVEWEIDGEYFAAKTNFIASSVSPISSISLKDYLATLYEPVDMAFNNFSDYTENQLETVIHSFPQAANPDLTDMHYYLLSHVSNNMAVVSFKINPTNEGFYLEIKYVKGKTDDNEILKILNDKSLKVHLSDGTSETVNNPYNFN